MISFYFKVNGCLLLLVTMASVFPIYLLYSYYKTSQNRDKQPHKMHMNTVDIITRMWKTVEWNIRMYAVSLIYRNFLNETDPRKSRFTRLRSYIFYADRSKLHFEISVVQILLFMTRLQKEEKRSSLNQTLSVKSNCLNSSIKNIRSL